MASWVLQKEQADISLMSRVLGITPTLAQVLVNRGIRTRNTALAFLQPGIFQADNAQALGIGHSQDNEKIKDIHAGLATVAQSVALGEKIVVYGDYDADGVMSTAILFKSLLRLGANVYYYIPQREEEGYGLNINAVKGLADTGARLIIACDNGISAIAEAALARKLGLKLVIIDHHEPGFTEDESGNRQDIIPEADAVIDPKQQACGYPFKHLCAAGLSYKFANLLYAHIGKALPLREREEYLALAAVATICDIVDLCDENRELVSTGLDVINKNTYPCSSPVNIGLNALIKAKSCKSIDTHTVGFLLGPCINASGRLDHARYAVELFITQDPGEAEELAGWLVRLNEERRTITKQAFEEIDARLAQNEKQPSVLVIYEPDIHESIAGIVAGRIKDKYHRPTIVLTKTIITKTPPGRESEEQECTSKGSARSIPGYNIFEELYKCRTLFKKFGGHPMAAGLTLPTHNIDALRELLNSGFNLSEEDLSPRFYYDAQLELPEITFGLARELALLEPYGKGNRPPLFCSRAQSPAELRIIPDKDTIIATFKTSCGRRIKALCFGKLKDLAAQVRTAYPEANANTIMAGNIRSANLQLDMLYELEINEYNGNSSVQMRLRDFKILKPLGANAQ